MKKKIALIFGITGQDGSLLARFLLKKNYIIHGVKRRSSSFNTSRIDDLYEDINQKNKNFNLHYGDVTDSTNIISIIKKIKPNEIYNLAAQSHVKVSFETPEYTANADALGTLRILEAIRILNLQKRTKFYQASTSEMFGDARYPQNESTPFKPNSPYAVAKLYAYWITKSYRTAYNIFCSNGVLFNHESYARGETFVSKKIIQAAIKIKYGKQDVLYLGNLNSIRDWGDARDYVESMWKILQQREPDDFLISTGKGLTVKKFVNTAFNKIGIKIIWRGKGLKEIGINKKNNKIIIRVDKRYFRPNEVNALIGNSKKSQRKLNWKPKISFNKLVDDMIEYEKNKINI
tara:strand:- start:5599 stop:6639 length:1041 start_codon:yes stop_codon:yes gene_type:complete